ncbi:grasp-with-spasm system SPASM domain peptide maturase [Chryseobacterium sp. KMC2]|uniref:grasp-with-spasm system SPASM domain peptide maturase n=1 Tax=Chryseobacterium sp. KMC2 TaxID=2800705 RepID=UPI0019229538|nr:grasp-with-spasm system SPASM domain peptide maturase [Chryseobacterium sp. KMC2]MBL3549869.1 grasp-with-spasm system SPASM domain peptide maturase [Chryseobacterium sp. KMC2]
MEYVSKPDSYPLDDNTKMTYFNRFACCLVTYGHTRSIICDVQRNNYYLIPNSLYTLLTEEFPNFSIEEIYDSYGKENEKYLKDYLNFLLVNEIGFIDTQIIKELIPLNLNYKVAEPISSIIIDLSKESFFLEDSVHIAQFIDTKRIKHLQIRCYDVIDVNMFFKFLNNLSRTTLKGIEIILPYKMKLENRLLNKNIIKSNDKINRLIYFGCDKYKQEKYLNRIIIYVEDKIINQKSCGLISSKYFNSNLETYTLSNSHNSCLYKKISIDSEGNIRNCPSMPQSFGNIKDITLEEALSHPDFKKYWNLTKDSIEVCKDCEFRYICTDCRAYTERTHTHSEGLDTSKPLKCGYNPYTGEWEEWSTNPLKEKAINYYEMQDLVKI